MNSAMSCSDYAYINHFGKRVCFHFKFSKRVKTKVKEFLKNEHQESQIMIYLNELGLKLEKNGKSNRYIHYNIVEA